MSEGADYTGLGWALIACGVIAAGVSFALPTSISVDAITEATNRLNAAVAGLPSPPSLAGVINIGLLQRQVMVFHAGVTAILAGSIFIGSGAIVRQLRVRVRLAPPDAISPSPDVPLSEMSS